MKTIFYIDENCRDKLELMPALREVMQHENASEIKVAVTAGDFFYRTAFRMQDKDLYFNAKQPSTSSRERAFLTRHPDLLELLPVYPGGHADIFQSTFIKLVQPFLLPKGTLEERVGTLCEYIASGEVPDERKTALVASINALLGNTLEQRLTVDTLVSSSGILTNAIKKMYDGESGKLETFLGNLKDKMKGNYPLGNYSGLPKGAEKIPIEMEAEIRKNAAHIIRKYTPELTSPDEESEDLAKRIDLTINLNDPTRARHDAAILAACMRSRRMERLIKERDNHKFQDMFDALATPLLTKNREFSLYPEIEAEIRENVARIIKHYVYKHSENVEIPKEQIDAIDITINAQNPTNEHDTLILRAGKKSSRLQKFIKDKHPDKFDELFKRAAINFLTAQKSQKTNSDHEAEVEVRRIAAQLIKDSMPELTSEDEPLKKLAKRLDLSINQYDHDLTQQRYNDIILKACQQSALLKRNIVKKHAVAIENLFVELATPFLANDAKEALPPKITNEIKKIAADILYNTALKSSRTQALFDLKLSEGFDLTIADNPTSERDKIILDACRQSEKFQNFLKKRENNYSIITDDLADNEMLSFIRNQLWQQTDNPGTPETNFVVVSDDAQFVKRLQWIGVKGAKKYLQCMGSKEFLTHCLDKAEDLRAKAPQAQSVAEHTTLERLADALEAACISLNTYHATTTPTASAEPEPLPDPLEKPSRKSSTISWDDHDRPSLLSLRKNTIYPTLPNVRTVESTEPKKALPEFDATRLGWVERFAYAKGLSPRARQEFIAKIRGADDSHRLEEIKKGELCYITRGEGSKPYLFLPRKFKNKLDLSNENFPHVVRDILQVALGLNDDELAEINISYDSKYYKVTLPTGADDSDDIVQGLHDVLGIPIRNTKDTPISEKNLELQEIKPAIPPPPVKIPRPPKRLLRERINDVLSELEIVRPTPPKESAAISLVKEGAIYFSCDGRKSEGNDKTSTNSKATAQPRKIRATDVIEPFLYFSLDKFREVRPTITSLAGITKEKTAATEVVRDILQFHLGLTNEQAAAIEVKRGENGTDSKLLKVKLPPITTDSETLSPSEVAILLSHPDVLGIPIRNTMQKPVTDDLVKLEIKIPHQSNSNTESLENARFLSKAALIKDKSTIAFIGNGEKSEPYLFLPQRVRKTLNFRDDAEVLEIVRDMVQATLGLRDDQLATITLEKIGDHDFTESNKLYRIKLPGFTYAYDRFMHPEPVEQNAASTETIDAAEVARTLNHELDIPLFNSPEHPTSQNEFKYVGRARSRG